MRFILPLVLCALPFARPDAQSVQYRSESGVEYRSLVDNGAIAKAESALAREPRNVQRIIELGIAQSGARKFREAITTFSRGLTIAPNDPMLYRWRGHRNLSVREFPAAMADLLRGIELDSANYGILYHLGVLRFARGEFDEAVEMFSRSIRIAPDPGELSASTDWLWMSLMRAGKPAEAAAHLARKTDTINANNAYTRRLMLYRGQIGPDAIATPADTSDVSIATLAYAVGNWYLLRGDRARARAAFERSIQSGGWPAFGFIVSEIELRRMRYEDSRPGQDSLAPLVQRLGMTLLPLTRLRDSVALVIRRDSGTVRADSAYIRFRTAFEVGIRRAAQAFDTGSFQVIVYPDGASAFRMRNEFDVDGNASAQERVIADSVVRYLATRGVAVVTAEGDAYFEPSERMLSRTFDRFLTPPMREMNRILALEQEKPAGGDGALSLGWDDVAARLASTDAFLANPAASPGARRHIEQLHRMYLAAYLGTWPNTPGFDRDTRYMVNELRASFERYVAERGTTPTGRLISQYLVVLKQNQWYRNQAIEEFLRESLPPGE